MTGHSNKGSGTAAYVVIVAAGSALLFMVQPMIARMALPRLGGSPAVWNSAMVVYQTLLLAGYAYAHLASRMSRRAQGMTHAALLIAAGAWLPIGVMDANPGQLDPVLWTPLYIAASIGPLFLAASAQGPLLQKWQAADHPGRDPYPLYAASNLGSLAGLLSYPLLIEPFLGAESQSLIWTVGYIVLAAATIRVGLRGGQNIPTDTAERTPPPEKSQHLRWIGLSAIPSGLMLSTTTFLTTDIVATPLLWVLPLGVYLLTFVSAFSGRRQLVESATTVAPFLVLISIALSFHPAGRMPAVSIGIGLMTLYAVGTAIHGRLHETRPAADHLTGFYLSMSTGGAIGGALCAIAAPAVLDWTWEHPALLVASAAVMAGRPLLLKKGIQRLRTPTAAVAIAIIFAVLVVPYRYHADLSFLAAIVGLTTICVVGSQRVLALALSALVLAQATSGIASKATKERRFRSYFGSYRILDVGATRILMHGTTAHGMQIVRPAPSSRPLTYYTDSSGVARGLSAARSLYGQEARIAVVGLGTGTLACQASPGQRWTFIEIDPEIVRIATDGTFTYLKTCTPDARVVEGDARKVLTAMPSGSQDILVLDAFSSDAIPMHLVTREAFDAYHKVVGRRGAVLVHISNRHLDLEPVLAAMPGWNGILLDDLKEVGVGAVKASSTWVALSKDPDVIQTIARSDRRWRPAMRKPGFTGWTDARSSILPILQF